MDTQQPSQSSQSASPTPKLDDIHAELKKLGIGEPEAIVVCVIGQAEMIIGEVYDHAEYLTASDPYASPTNRALSIFEKGDFVAVKNPVRLVRLAQQGPDGRVAFQPALTKFDLIEKGIIEVKPVAAFFLSWLDEGSQASYCIALRSYLDGQRLARAKAAGLHIPGEEPNATPKVLQDIRDFMKKR